MRLKHAPRVFLVVDPVQDYEESLAILGVHGSLAAAKLATRRYRRRMLPATSPRGLARPLVDPGRDIEVQCWQGEQHLGTWKHDPHTDQWSEGS